MPVLTSKIKATKHQKHIKLTQKLVLAKTQHENMHLRKTYLVAYITSRQEMKQ